MRPLKPWPMTRARSTPSSRANLRTEGPACARENPGSAIGAKSLRSVVATAAARAAPASGALARSGAAAGETPRGVGGGAAALREGGAVAGGAVAGGTVASGAAAGAEPLARTVAMRSPVLTLPPLLVWSFSTTPTAVEGTSMVALSDSSVTSGESMTTVSPGFTSTSMTATSLKLPMSGTRTSTRLRTAFMWPRGFSHLPWHRFRRIDAERLDRFLDRRPIDARLVGERLERCHRDVVAVDLEMPP